MERLPSEPNPGLEEAIRGFLHRGRRERAGEAAYYEVLGIPPRQKTWRRVTPVQLRHTKAEAIAEARHLLDEGHLAAASVGGRGTPRWPTPAGEVTVYRGVGATWSADAFFGMALATGETVEKR
jgi:hypothetical protein